MMKDGDRYTDPAGNLCVYNEEQLEAAKAYEDWADWILNSDLDNDSPSMEQEGNEVR